ADKMPMARPMTRPMAVASRPSTNVLAIAALSSGHTGRLPLIDRPQLKVTKWCSQEKYCETMLPLSPFLSLYCWIFALLALGWIHSHLCTGWVPMRIAMNTRNVMTNSVGIVHRSLRETNRAIVPHVRNFQYIAVVWRER